MDVQIATRRWQQHRQREAGCDWCGVMEEGAENGVGHNWTVCFSSGEECQSVFCPACASQYQGVKSAFDTVSKLLS
ncbi:hypothetical protein ACTRXD_16930 [Nitrospira sp. T9]|uniref:hypothetical protein n=1 Tax=unclassified Nitrospira TaxID=2652172 RepID=UPI003F94D8EE